MPLFMTKDGVVKPVLTRDAAYWKSQGWGVDADADGVADAGGGPDLTVSQTLSSPLKAAVLGNLDLAKRYGARLLFTDPAVGGVGDGTTDNTAAFNTALTLLPNGGELYFPPGVYLINGATDVVPGGVTLAGSGYDWSDPTAAAPARASVIRAGAVMTRLVQLGSDYSSSSAGQTRASATNLCFDGRDLAVTVVKTAGRRNFIINCQVYWGSSVGVLLGGQNSHLIGTIVAQNNTGDCVVSNGGGDNKIYDCQIRQCGTTGATIRMRDAHSMISRNHLYCGQNSIAGAAQALIVLDPATSTLDNAMIANNTIEGVIGPEIMFYLADSAHTIRAVSITNNTFYRSGGTGQVDNVDPVIQVSGAGSATSVTVSGNTMTGNSDTNRYMSMIDYTGSPVSTIRWLVQGNVGLYVAAFITGTPGNSGADRPSFANNMARINSAGANRRTNYSTKSTFSGNGSTTAFVAQHFIAETPQSITVTPGSAAAATDFYVTADATNLTVTFLTAPASGTNNVVLNWSASM